MIAHVRIIDMLYGPERDPKEDLSDALKRVAAEWQRDKSELARLRAEFNESEVMRVGLMAELYRLKKCTCFKHAALKEAK